MASNNDDDEWSEELTDYVSDEDESEERTPTPTPTKEQVSLSERKKRAAAALAEIRQNMQASAAVAPRQPSWEEAQTGRKRCLRCRRYYTESQYFDPKSHALPAPPSPPRLIDLDNDAVITVVPSATSSSSSSSSSTSSAEPTNGCFYHPGKFSDTLLTNGLRAGWSCCRDTHGTNANAYVRSSRGCRFSPFHKEDALYTNTILKFGFSPTAQADYERKLAEQSATAPAPAPAPAKPAVLSPAAWKEHPHMFHEHVVSASDTLEGLALRYGVPSSEIRRLNRFQTVPEMQIIGRIYIPKSGEPRSAPPPAQHRPDGSVAAFQMATRASTAEAKYYLSEAAGDVSAAVMSSPPSTTTASPRRRKTGSPPGSPPSITVSSSSRRSKGHRGDDGRHHHHSRSASSPGSDGDKKHDEVGDDGDDDNAAAELLSPRRKPKTAEKKKSKKKKSAKRRDDNDNDGNEDGNDEDNDEDNDDDGGGKKKSKSDERARRSAKLSRRDEPDEPTSRRERRDRRSPKRRTADKQAAAAVIQRAWRACYARRQFDYAVLAEVWSRLSQTEERLAGIEFEQSANLRRKHLLQRSSSSSFDSWSSFSSSLSQKSNSSSRSSSFTHRSSGARSSSASSSSSASASSSSKYGYRRDARTNTFDVDVPTPVTRDFCDLLIGNFIKGRQLSLKAASLLLIAACDLLKERHASALHRLRFDSAAEAAGHRLTIVGDLHGQYKDLVAVFRQNGRPSARHCYLFNGDLVDRGAQGVEVCLTVFALMLALPQRVFVNRGNHEALAMNVKYAFNQEVYDKYDAAIFELFQEIFCALPLATVVQNKLFVVHGGVPHVATDLDEIAALPLGRQPPSGEPDDRQGQIFKALLWNDPRDGMSGAVQSLRGRGAYLFGADVTDDFLQRTGLTTVVRSHETFEDGYATHHCQHVVTVFSASDYCGVTRNYGSVLVFPSVADLANMQFLRYHAPPLSSSSSSSSNATGITAGVAKLRRAITDSLADLIFLKLRELRAAFEAADRDFLGLITFSAWKQLLNKCLQVDLPWLLLRRLLVPAAAYDDPAVHSPEAFLHYERFLNGFSFSASTPLIDAWDLVVFDSFCVQLLSVISADDLLDLLAQPGALSPVDHIVAIAASHGFTLQQQEADIIHSVLVSRFHFSSFQFHSHQSNSDQANQSNSNQSNSSNSSGQSNSNQSNQSNSSGQSNSNQSNQSNSNQSVMSSLSPESNKLADYLSYHEMRLKHRKEHEEFWTNQALLQIAAQLKSDHGSIRRAFRSLDSKNRGRISVRRLEKHLVKLALPVRLSKEQAAALVKYLDADHSGKISRSEFERGFCTPDEQKIESRWARRAIAALSKVLVANSSSLRQIFIDFDGDQSGAIELDEFLRAIRIFNDQLKEPLTEEQLTQLFFAMDADGSGRVEWKEFLSIFSSKHKVAHA